MSRRMFHHLSLGVGDLHASGHFYDALLAPLGYRRVFDGDDAIGYGLIDDQDLLLLNRSEAPQPPSEGFHLAFAAADRAAVDAGHAAALHFGGRDNGAPRLRPDYGAHYYAAFLIDPDGHHVELVITAPLDDRP